MSRIALCVAILILAAIPAFAAPKTGKPFEVKVWVLNFDPIVDAKLKTRLHTECRWNDPRKLAEQYAADVKEASGGLVTYRIIGWDDVDEFPVKIDGFRYTVKSFLECHRNNKGWHQPDMTDYPKVISQFRLAERVMAGEFEEVWWFGAPYFGFAESAMAGRDAFGINGPAFDDPQVKSSRAFAIMGYNYERGPAEMIHNLCHRTEATMTRMYGGWQIDQLVNDWARFAANAHQSKGVAAVGTCHYPPNATSDYDYANKRFVESSGDDWLNYPELTGAKTRINCETWGGPDYQRNYLKWWFARLPRAVGTNPTDGRLYNWWEYLYHFNDYDRHGRPRIPSDPKQERQAAKTVLSLGGKVTLWTKDGKVRLTDLAKLPGEHFEILTIELTGKPLSNDELSTFSNLPRLHSLNLNGSRISPGGFVRLTNLPALDWLAVSNCGVADDDLKAIARLPQLGYLELNANPLTDAGLTPLAKHPTLRELHLTESWITDAGVNTLREIPQLSAVSLAGTRITDIGVDRLASISQLNRVWLGKTAVTDEAVSRLKQAKPTLTVYR